VQTAASDKIEKSRENRVLIVSSVIDIRLIPFTGKAPGVAPAGFPEGRVAVESIKYKA
jgi:hypothetical protein